MPIFNNPLAGAAGLAGGADAYEIKRSLRFNADHSSQLYRDFTTDGDVTTWTWSGWVKRSGTGFGFLFQGGNTDYNDDGLLFDASDRLAITFHNGSNGVNGKLTTNQVFKDLSAWYHIVMVTDTNNSNGNERMRLYVNGLRVTDLASNTNPAQSSGSHDINRASRHSIGTFRGTNDFFNGYIAEVNFLDGLTPGTATDDANGSVTGVPNAEYLTDFGEFNSTTGVWDPIEYTGNYRAPVNQTQTWSSFGGSGVYSSNYAWTKLFDGDHASKTVPANNNSISADFTSLSGGGISYSSSLEVHYNRNTNAPDVRVNGSSISAPNDGAYHVYRVTGSGTLTSVGTDQRTTLGSGDCSLFKIVIDGEELVDSGVTPKSNGFKLDFDPAAGRAYSGGVSSTSTVISGYPAANGFDGSAGSSGTANWYLQGANQTITVDLSSYNVDASNSVGFNVRLGGPGSSATVSVTATIGGTAYTQTFQNSSTQDQLLTFNGSGTVTTIVATLTQANSSYGWGFTGVQVDGSYLVNLQAPGVDASGSGNHFTPKNLLAATGTYLDDMSGTERSGFAWSQAFDGNLDAGAVPNASTSWTFTPSIPISFSTLAIYAYKDTSPGTLKINGTDVTSQVPNHNQIGPNQRTVISGISSPITSIQNISNGGLANIVFAGLEIDGELLLDKAEELDVVIDSPTGYEASSGNNGGNYAVMDPLSKRAEVFTSNGNLDVSVTSGLNSWDGRKVFSNIGVTSGKWYAEMTVHDNGSVYAAICGNKDNIDETQSIGWQSQGWGYYKGGIIVIQQSENSSGIPAFGAGDTIGIALDVDNLKVKWYKNGTQVGTTAGYTITSGLTWFFAYDSYDASSASWNFGQRPFKHTPPTGFKTLCTQNLPDPSVKKSSTAFDIKLWSGDDAAQKDINTPFSPDLVWFKSRNAQNPHSITDSVRGAPNKIGVNTQLAEETNPEYGQIEQLNANGFRVKYGTHNSDSLRDVNKNGYTYVAWVWDGGDTFSNSAGTNGASHASSGRANKDAGISIVSYVGTNQNMSLRHGLDVAPEIIICKSRDSTQPWVIGSKADNNWGNYLHFDSTGGGTLNLVWQNTAPTSQVFTVGATGGVNANGEDFIAYCFAPSPGFSAMGKYKGNGNANGNFVYTGFKVKFLMRKNLASQNWLIHDSARDPINSAHEQIYPSNDSAEYGFLGNQVDLLSNGFKIRGNNAGSNDSNGSSEYLYLAFAEDPFKYARG